MTPKVTPITIVPVEKASSIQIRGSRKVPGAGADLYIKMGDVLNALRATGHSSAVEYLNEAWQEVTF